MTHAGSSIFFIIGFIVYIAIMIFVGWYFSKGKTEGQNFLTGGAQLPFYLIFSTVAASLIGTGTSMGATANGFKSGWGGSAYAVGCVAGILVMLLFCSARKYNLLTMAEEAQFYYGGNKIIRNVMGIMMFVVQIVWLGNHMNGGSKYLSYVTGLPSLSAKIITALAFAVYVFIGGYLAVVWTDLFQLAIILIGFTAITVKAIPAAGGYAAIATAYEAAGNSGAMSFLGITSLGIMPALALMVSTGMGVIGSPTHRIRIYTAATDKVAKKAFLTSAAVFAIFCVVPSLIGMSAFTIATQKGASSILANPDYAFSFMATEVLGPVLGLFFLIAGLSATLSSGDSDALCGVTVIMTDVIPALTGRKIDEREYKKYSRISLIVLLALSFVATLYANDVIGYINSVIGSLLPGLAVTMLLGKLWKRATWQGGLAAILTGTLFGVLFLAVPSITASINAAFGGPAIPASFISLAGGILVSLCTPVNTVSDEEALKSVIASRGNALHTNQ